MPSCETVGVYDAFYYANYCGERPYVRDEGWLNFFGTIADHIVSEIGPRTALDAGCAMGFLVESLRDRGVEAYGVDVSDYAIGQVREDVRPFCAVGSITEPFPRRYDLIINIEVLEHLPPEQGERAVANFCRHTDDVIFTSTPDDYKEATHLNVQPPEYWAELFARNGFFRDVEYDATFIAAWGVRYRRANGPASRAVVAYERRLSRLEKQIRAQRELGIEQRGQLAAKQQQIAGLEARAAQLQARVEELHLERQAARSLFDAERGALQAALQEERRAAAAERELRDADEYRRQVERARRAIAARTPAGATVAVVSGGDDALVELVGRRGWHFPRTPEGWHAGSNPADDREAVAHLEALRRQGAGFIAFPATATWWLDHYTDFTRHLRTHYPKIYGGESGVIFDLRGKGQLRDRGDEACGGSDTPAAGFAGNGERGSPC